MKRFVVLFAVGALLLGGGQVWLSVVLHPASSVGAIDVLYSALTVMLGTATVGTAMLGMAETYERLAAQAGRLLGVKDLPAEPPLVSAPEHLRQRSRSFWRAYALTAAGLALFLLGVLAISVLLADAVYFFYLAGLSAAVVILGLGITLWERYVLRRAHREHTAVARSVRALAAQPDRPPEAPDPGPRPARPRRQRSARTRTGPPMRPLIVR